MLHERVVSGFDLEILFGEPCLTAMLRAVLAAALGPDSALDLATYGAVAPEDRFLHVRLSDIDLHGGDPQGDVTIKLRLGLGPSASEAGLGRRVDGLAPEPRPTLPTPAAPRPARPAQPAAGRPAPIPQGPPPPEPAPRRPASAGPLPETHLALKLRVRGEGATIVVEPGVIGRALIGLGTWLTEQVSSGVGLAATAFLEAALREHRFELPGLGHLPRIAWTWLAGDAQTRPAFALLANLDLDLRERYDQTPPPASARGSVAAARSHLPPGVALRLAASAAALGRLQRAAFWRFPKKIERAELRKLELLLRAGQTGYVDVRVEFEIELPGLNGELAYQVPVVPRVAAGALRWEVGAVARETDLNTDLWSGIWNALVTGPNLFGAGISWAGDFVRGGADELGRRLAQGLAPLATALPLRLDLFRVAGRAATLGLAAAAVAVDLKGLSFHFEVRP